MPLIPDIFGTLPTATVSPGTFLEGAAYTMDMAAKLINATYDLATTTETDYDAKLADLLVFLNANVAGTVSAGSITAPTPTEPSMTIADTTYAAVAGDISTQATAIIAESVSKFGTFFSTYFPSNDTTYAAAEAYLQSAITNTTSGIVPVAIKAAILADSESDVLDAANRAEADLYEAQSVKRHRFPSGFAAGQARRIAQDALDKIAASSRAIAIKDFELSHQTALEAVRMAIASRAQAIGAAQQYIAGVVAQGWNSGIQSAGTGHQAEVSKLQAAYQAYAGRVNAAELALKATTADKTLSLDADKSNQMAELDQLENHVKAFLQDANLTAHKMISMLNNLRAGSSATYSVSA